MYGKNKRPRVHIPYSDWDKVLIACTLFACSIMVVYPLYSWDDLPDQIATKFSRSGAPTSYSSKSTLLVLSMVGLAVSLPLLYLARFPHLYNYGSVQITESNAKPYYRLGVTLIYLIAAYTAILFAVISYDMISSAKTGSRGSFGVFYEVFVFAGLVAILGWYIWKASKIQKKFG